MEAIINFLKEILQILKDMKLDKLEEHLKVVEISRVPMFGDKDSNVRALQAALVRAGFELKIDEDFGPKTQDAVIAFQKSKGSRGSGVVGPKTLEWLSLKLKEAPKSESISTSSTPWMDEAEKHMGKHETDKSFAAKLIPFWSKTGLNYKSIVGSKYAWCGLFVAAMLLQSGVDIDVRGLYRARNSDNLGVEIPYKKIGIPFGAVVTLNNKGNCSLSKSNHVTFSASECTAEMVRTSGAFFIGKGGNQGNRAKNSGYAISKICAVRSPDPKKLPVDRVITGNKRCAVGKVATESTR